MLKDFQTSIDEPAEAVAMPEDPTLEEICESIDDMQLSKVAEQTYLGLLCEAIEVAEAIKEALENQGSGGQ